MKNLRLVLPIFLLILIVFLLTGCGGVVPSPGPAEGDVTTINGQIKMPGACCDPLGEEKQGMSRAESTYDETKSWTIIPGAVVELKNASNCKIVDTTESDKTGYYEFEDVQPGLYIITAYCPSNEQYLLKDVAEKVSGQALNAGIPDCDSTSLALVIEFLEDCYDDSYLCFGKYNQVYRMVEKIAEDVGEVDIPTILAHDDFGVLDDDDTDDLVDLVCDKLMSCCGSSAPTPGPSPGPTPDPCAGNVAPVITVPNDVTVDPKPIEPHTWEVTATDDGILGTLEFSLVSVEPTPTNDFTIDATSGVVSWDPTCADIIGDIDTTYTITVEVDDGCTTDQDSFNVTLTAEPCAEYILTVNIIGNGSVTKDPLSPTYVSGTTVTLDPEADSGWNFTGWSGADAGDLVDNTDGTWTINMDANKTVTATFILDADIPDDQYTLTVNIIGNGSVTKDPLSPTYVSGTPVELNPEADTGWVFTGWSGDLTGSNDPETITMDENKTVTATFEFHPSPEPVNLGTYGDGFVILSKTGITNVPTSAITGDIGTSPASSTTMNNITCDEITGQIYGVDDGYTGGTCYQNEKTLVDNAVLDMGIAYGDAMGRTVPAPVVELGGGNIGGLTIYPGLYKWSSGVNIATDVTLSGGADDVWIFQIEGDLTIATSTEVVLAGGAKASNIFWQVGGGTGAILETYSTFEGTILSAKQVIIRTGAVLNGRAWADSQVTLEQNKVTLPSP